MAKNTGLGKGLDALFSDKTVIENITEERKEGERIEKIKVMDIEPNRNQPRRNFDMEAIEELAESIKIYGIIQPIIVSKKDGYYEIVAGERRWRASKKAGLTEIPCIIRSDDERKSKEIALIENIQREDLNSIEEALAYKKLISDFNLTQEELSKRIGKSRVTITNTLRLLNLSEGVQQYIIEGVISEGHGRALLGINDSKLQCELAQNVIDDKLSVRELEVLIRKLKSSPTREKAKSINEINPYYKDITYKLENYFGTKVNITNKNNKGKIEIEYYSEEDLQRILEIINL